MMKRFTVFHRISPTFMDDFDDMLAHFPDGFRPVATVETDDVSHVYRMTQHITKPWWEHPWWEHGGVTLIQQSRSTSVGDVIVEEGTTNAWLVGFIGLTAFTVSESR